MSRSLAVLAVFVCACSTLPPPHQELAQARAVFDAAQADPHAAARAQAELQIARTRLEEAERLAREGADPAEVRHQAYLAEQRARIARELGQARAGEAQVARESEERARVLLESRTEEKYRARAAEAALARAKAAQEAQSLARERLESEVQRLDARVRELQARPTERGWIITLGSDLLFDVGRASLKPGGRRALEHVARVMRKDPERNIVIEGFTDDSGRDVLNQRLSERRANEVRRALVKAGVAPERIVARGLGAAFPVASNESPAGRQLNRRVEILIGEHAGRAATGASSGR